MAEFRYVILRSDGKCLPLFGPDDAGASKNVGGTLEIPRPSPAQLKEPPLPASEFMTYLQSEGWRPVRETGLGDGSALILFERDCAGA